MDFWRRIGRGSLLALAGAAVSLLIAEGGLRLFFPQRTGSPEFAYDPERGAIPVPGRCGRTSWPGVYEYERCNNSLGLRGTKEYSSEKEGRRLLFLGDSFTYGTGVNDGETFSAQLQGRFDASGERTEVVNAGNGGTGTDYALKFFQVLGRRLEPDVTAVFFFWNDFQDNSRGTFFAEENGGLVAKPLADSLAARKSLLDNAAYRWLTAHSHLANLLKGAVVGFFVNRYSDANELYVNSNPWAFTEEARGATRRYVLALRDEVRASGGELVFFYIPHFNQAAAYFNDGSISDEESFLAGLLEESGIAFVSATPVLKASGIPLEELYYKDEGHWKAAAHRVFAEFLESYFSILSRSKL